MRIAVLILSLCLALYVADEVRLLMVAGAIFDQRMEDAVGLGLLFLLPLVVGGALALQKPGAARWFLVAAAGIGILIGANTPYENMLVWGPIAGALAVMVHFGRRELPAFSQTAGAQGTTVTTMAIMPMVGGAAAAAVQPDAATPITADPITADGALAPFAPVTPPTPPSAAAGLSPFAAATPDLAVPKVPILLRPTLPYHQTVALMRQAMAELSARFIETNPATGLVDGRWRYWGGRDGIRVVAGFFADQNGLGVLVKGEVGWMPVGFPYTRRRAAEVARRFAELVAAATPESVAEGAVAAPRLGAGSCPHHGLRRGYAILDAILLGGLGYHRFYLGSWGLGLCILGLSLLLPLAGGGLGIAEGIRLALMKQDAFDRRYNLTAPAPFKF